MAQQTSKPAPVAASGPCAITEQPDGSALVTFTMDPISTKRLNLKRGTMPLEMWLYENVLKQAVSSAAY